MSHLTTVTRGNGTTSSLQYDLASRLTTLNHTMTSQSESLTFGYTSASQLLTRTSSNPSYDSIPAEVSRAYTANGLNEYANVGGTAYSNDRRGNLTSDGTRTLAYDLENHLLSVVGGAGLTLQYDPLGRIWETTSGSTVTQFLYDGDRLVGEYSPSGTLQKRYGHGPRTDDPEVWYQGSAMTTREWIHADERGSVIATSDSTGTPTIYTYGPYGEPTPAWTTGSRFRYTGQIALPEAQLYHYKARVYDPGIGRFFQADPVGTKDDLNLYSYVHNDPIDKTDPTGLDCKSNSGTTTCDVPVTGSRIPQKISFPTPKGGLPGNLSSTSLAEHKYDYVTPHNKSDSAVQQSMVNDPVPANNDKPATPTGTPNNASPDGGRGVLAAVSAALFGDDPRSPVMSYSSRTAITTLGRST